MHGRDARNPPWQMHICVSVLSVYVRVVSVGGECMCKCMWVSSACLNVWGRVYL